MDSIKGAILLRERLEQCLPVPASGAEEPVPDDALPIFHWLSAHALAPTEPAPAT